MSENLLCMRLKHLRHERGMSLDSLALKTHLHKKYLVAIEECRYNELPGGVYKKNFVSLYIKGLGLNSRDYAKDLNQECGHTYANTLCVPERQSLRTGSFGRGTIIGSTIFALVIFVGWQIWHVITPPRIWISSPTEDSLTRDTQTLISGRTEPETIVEINGSTAFVRPDGTFSQITELQNGLNTITIRANKKHGLFTTVSRKIILEAPREAVSTADAPPAIPPSKTSSEFN